jgi:LacI family transcriptional regulator
MVTFSIIGWQMSKVTIKDIAKEARVGISTVSRVLNGYDIVKEETRERILEICRQHNYIPNAAARMLVKKTSHERTVALLMPMIAHQFFFELISDMQDVFRGHSVNAMIFNTDNGRESVIHYLIELRVSAVIVMGNPALSTADTDLLEIYQIPLLYVDRHESGFNYISYDNFRGGELVGEYLYQKKCKNIMLVGILDDTQQQKERFSGVRKALGNLDPTISIEEIQVEDEHGAYSISTRLMRDPDIDGYFFFTDTMAMAGLQARGEIGTNAVVIGYDDIFPARFMNLTTIQQSSKVLGHEAGEAVVKLIQEGYEATPRFQTILEPKLIIRKD